MVVGDKKRLINCDFLNARAFTKLSNKAKLLYVYMFVSADDKGFVDNTDDIIEKLTNQDNSDGLESMQLLNNDYVSALIDLLNAGYIYEFVDRHNNRVHLLKHWYYHNKYIKGLSTTYYSYLQLVTLENNEYVLKKKSDIKEIKLNEINVNENKLNETKKQKLSDEEWNKLLNELEEINVKENEDD